jgi:hypothetical protein
MRGTCRYEGLTRRVAEAAAICRPERIHGGDGSREEYDRRDGKIGAFGRCI